MLKNPSDNQRVMWNRRMKKEKFKGMVRDELQKLLSEHGLTEDYTLDLFEQTIQTARAKGDVTNLMRAIENLQDMHGMKDKHLVKTTEQIEATSSTKLIDELRETEDKLVATKTTISATDIKQAKTANQLDAMQRRIDDMPDGNVKTAYQKMLDAQRERFEKMQADEVDTKTRKQQQAAADKKAKPVTMPEMPFNKGGMPSRKGNFDMRKGGMFGK